MRDKIIALAMCGLLAMTLFACGENRGTSNDSDTLGDENNYTSGTTNGGTSGSNGSMGGTTNGNSNGSTNGGGSSNGSMGGSSNGNTSGIMNGGTNGGTNNGTNGNNADQSDVMGDSALRSNTINPANGNADRTATWEQMLQNGRVHDRDGFLFDGENSHWSDLSN